MLEELLRVDDGRLKKGGQELIKGLDIQIYKGEILGLFADNIREKQCILDIFNGEARLDGGRIFYEERRIWDYEAAGIFKNKIAVIESKSKLVSNLTVAENIFVVRKGFRKYFIRDRQLFRQAATLMSDFKLDLRPDEYAGGLTPLMRCMVELVKAYATGHRLIVCSDFTGFLSSIEVKNVLQTIFWLKKRGVGFIMVENYDELLSEYSDRLSVIHNGKTIRIFDGRDVARNTVYSLLMGENEERSAQFITSSDSQQDMRHPLMFELQKVCSRSINDLNLQLHPGEIISVLYQEEECGSEFISLLTGEIEPESGEMLLASSRYRPTGLWDAIKKGICFIDEDPIGSMLFYDMSVLDNLMFSMSNKVSGLWFHKKYRRSLMKYLEPIFGREALESPMSKLEPAMLQKLVYTKWLLYMPKLIVCKKPFSAVDVHMRQVTFQLIDAFLKKGIAVIILTSNTSEAHMMGGRVQYLIKSRPE